MMTKKAFISILVISCFFIQLSAQEVPRFEPADSTVIKMPKNQSFRFGYLVVLEDRTKPKGKTLRLPVFILKSRSANPKSDPILYTAGGPGSSSINTVQYGSYFSYLDDRDFIVFEQRGTRYAQLSLSCPELDSLQRANTWLTNTEAQREERKVKAAMQCQRRLEAEGNNLSAYNTTASAADIEDLRKVLGIKQFNLLSISYSTKIAQVLLRDYPNSIRSAVLDSPLPLWVSYDETSIQFYAEKLDKLLLDCAKDSLCSAAFPDLKRRFYQFLYNANIKPISISIKSPIDSSLVAVSLYGYQVASFVELGSTWKLAGLPKMMEQLCQGDYSILQSYVASLLAPESLSMGMRLSVWCSEEYPFNKEDNVSKKKGIPAVFANMRSMAVPLAICKEWNTRKASAKENRPFRTNLPVLIINGEYDPDTPAAWGAEMQQRFVNSFHIVFKGMSHTPTQNWGNMCGMQLATQFFNQPTIRPLLPCVSMLQQLKFDTSK